jgi:rod shape-determining protein MreC
MVGQRKFWKGAVAAIGLLVLLSLPNGCSIRAKGVFRDLLTPVQSVFLTIGSSLKAGADSVRGFGGLAEENRLLNQSVATLQAEQRIATAFEADNIRLRDALEFRDQNPMDLIAAQVVSRSMNGWWSSVGIDKGTRDGIYSSQAVISRDGLIGRTGSTAARSAEVILVSDPACKISARITGSFGLVSGRGTSLKGYPMARMEFIHKDTLVEVGDEVVTSGLGGVFPRNLLIGYVESISTDEAGLYQVADILPQAVVGLTDAVFVTTREEEGAE